MGGKPDPLRSLARSIAEGTDVDWEAMAAAATSKDRDVVDQLRVVWELARAHHDGAAPVESTREGASAPPSTPIGSWAQLALLERLGAGSFGEVYRAWDPQLEREVALKIVSPESADLDPSRMAREGRLLARLRHPNIVTVYGATIENGGVGLWMELIRGITLEQALTRQGPFSARETSLIALDVCRALAAVHRAGLLHRDIKAQNVMREDGGRIVLMDFGTGREIAATRAGRKELVGTPLYLAPELFRLEPASVRTDIYSVGVLLYHLVTNSFPYPATTVDELLSLREAGRPIRLRDRRADLPATFVRLVNGAIHEDPERRYESAGALEQGVLEALDEVRNTAQRIPVPPSGLSGAPLGRVPSVAVLPFVDLNREKDLEYLAEGISDEITNALTSISGLRVAARTSAFQFKGRTEDIRRVGDVLNVETVLEGSVRATDGRLRVIVQLSNTTTGYQLWSERFEQPIEDVFAVQDKIATAVVRTLRVQLGAIAEVKSAPRHTLDAYTAYLKGRHLWNKRSEPELRRCVAFFEAALSVDPQYALAYAGLADAYVTLGIYGALPPEDVRSKVRSAADAALSLSDEMPELLTALGCLCAVYEWDWTEAEDLFRRAIFLKSDYPTAHHWLALNVLVPLQRFTEAESELRIALERDPLSLTVATSIGMTAYYNGRYERAIEEFKRTLELDNAFPLAHAFLGLAYAELGRTDKAMSSIETAVRLSEGSPENLAYLGYVHGLGGRPDQARRILFDLESLAQSRYVSPTLFAQLAIAAGDREGALDWLEKAHAQRAPGLAWVAVRPAFATLQHESRFRSLCQRMNLPERGVYGDQAVV
ncbi:MAG TPA: protein kinase [Vicinamibacterales bacterium]|nr:protein kinase [Vicinamibacterales bacterium]